MARLVLAWAVLALGLLGQTLPVPVTLVWDLDPTHEGATWEVEADGQMWPCGAAEVTEVDRRCTAQLPVGSYTIRLRGMAGDVVGGWSEPITATVPPAQPIPPGPFTLTVHFERDEDTEPPMSDFVVDTFTGTNGTNVNARTGETGATWTKFLGDSSNHLYIQGNALAGTGNGEAGYYASGTPASADYDVVADIQFLSTTGNVLIGILGRASTDGANYYRVDYNGFNDQLTFSKRVSGSSSGLDAIAWTTANHTLKLEMRGTAIKVYVDNVEVMGVTDSGVTAAGRVGLYKFSGVSDGPDFFRISGITGTDAAASPGFARIIGPAYRLIGPGGLVN